LVYAARNKTGTGFAHKLGRYSSRSENHGFSSVSGERANLPGVSHHPLQPRKLRRRVSIREARPGLTSRVPRSSLRAISSIKLRDPSAGRVIFGVFHRALERAASRCNAPQPRDPLPPFPETRFADVSIVRAFGFALPA